MNLKALKIVALLFAPLACQTVQQTGRSQFIVVSESQEIQLGYDAYKETLKQQQLSTRQDWQTQLRRVGQRIAAVAQKPEFKWEFNVIQGKEINAFALPGGKVAFWEGITPVAQDDAGQRTHAIRGGGEAGEKGFHALHIWISRLRLDSN